MITKFYPLYTLIFSIMNLGFLAFNLFFVHKNDRVYKDLIHSILKGMQSNSDLISTLNTISLTDEQKIEIQKNAFGK